MHHRRKRCKNRRSGCLLCKPHKSNGRKGMKCAENRQGMRARARLQDEYRWNNGL